MTKYPKGPISEYKEYFLHSTRTFIMKDSDFIHLTKKSYQEWIFTYLQVIYYQNIFLMASFNQNKYLNCF